jgi:prephenate dehydrogenase
MRLAVLGVGLIGGSIGMAARSRTGGRAGIHVTGYDPDERALQAALELGAIDEAAEELPTAVAGADVAFVAAPVGALQEAVRKTLAAVGPECVVSDVGSTKRAIARAIDDARFIGGHPLAGAETAGVEHARADLFDGAAWYLTPAAGVSAALLERLQRTIAVLGAQPVTIEAGAHDRLMAHLSHLPHVLANVLVSGAARALEREQRGLSGAARDHPDPSAGEVLGVASGLPDATRLAGPSFRDATRIAGANTGIWVDIYLSNREALIEALDGAIDRLGQVRAMLAGEDAGALRAWNDRARAERERLAGAVPAPNS